MSERRKTLVDCNPRWVSHFTEGVPDGIEFDCPEGHEGCTYVIPFTPAFDGEQKTSQAWLRTGDTFETLCLSPSIKGIAKYASREAAIADGRIAQYVHPRMWCSFHGFIVNGTIQFCGDSQ